MPSIFEIECFIISPYSLLIQIPYNQAATTQAGNSNCDSFYDTQLSFNNN